jgi:hypothetical protein
MLSTKSFHRCFLPSFGLFDQAVSEKIVNQKQELPVVAMFVNDWYEMCNLVSDWSSIKIAHFVPIR